MKTSFIKLKRAFRLRSAFTLVEILFSLTIGILVLSAAASLLILMARTNYKNTMVVDSSTDTRFVQEHLNRHLSTAISQFSGTKGSAEVEIRPVYSDQSTSTPTRYAMITYRVGVGGYCITNATASTEKSITLTCSAETIPEAGDYLLMDNPQLGTGILIKSVTPVGTSGTYTLSLSTTIGAATTAFDAAAAVVDVKAGGIATIQRQGAYMTTPQVAGENTVNLLWYESYPNTTPVILSNNVDVNNRHLFTPVLNAEGKIEAISWKFDYLAQTKDRRSAQTLPGTSTFWETNSATGFILPKSSATVPLGSPIKYSSSVNSSSSSTSTGDSSTTRKTTLRSTTRKTTLVTTILLD